MSAGQLSFLHLMCQELWNTGKIFEDGDDDIVLYHSLSAQVSCNSSVAYFFWAHTVAHTQVGLGGVVEVSMQEKSLEVKRQEVMGCFIMAVICAKKIGQRTDTNYESDHRTVDSRRCCMNEWMNYRGCFKILKLSVTKIGPDRQTHIMKQ